MKRVHLLLAFGVCTLLFFASLAARRIAPAQRDVAVTATGSFQRGGSYPGEEFREAKNVRAWGSWSGSDENTGTLRIGPFPAPRVLRFGIGGYPSNPGNTLHVELVGTAERLPIVQPAVGERWTVADVHLPATWAGRPIQLVAGDESKIIGGWLALSEPLRGGRGDGSNALLESLTAWAINGLALGLLYFAALRWLEKRAWLPSHWTPLGAGAVVATLAYATFWAFFAHAFLGTLFSGAILLAAVVAALRQPATESTDRIESTSVLKLMLAVGAFNLALLHLFPSSHDFYTLTANRYRDALPGDNALSHMIGERLFAGEPAKNAGDEWRSSDRPPLQTGWQLLTWRGAKTLGLDRRVASGTSAVWFQLLWVAGLYGLLRTLGLTPRRAGGWVAVCALSGFFVQNTVFTWPKLSAGAFACGAFALWILPADPERRRAQVAWGAVFAVLGWLSHGGVAFSFVALLPWIAWKFFRGEARHWLIAAGLFLVFALPWIAYQRLYDPPGDRLLKWHLAGFQGKDERSAAQAIRDSYTATPTREIWLNKLSNLRLQIQGDSRRLLDVSNATAADRRNEEFFNLRSGLTWWPLLAALAVFLTSRRVFTGDGGALLSVGLWALLTIVAWCLLLFSPLQAVIHQGSYAMMIALFAFFSVAIERSGSRWIAVLFALQAVALGTTWAVSNPAIHGPATGLPWVVAAALLLLGFVLVALREPKTARPAAPEAGKSPGRFAAAWQAWWQEPKLNLWVLATLALLLALRHPSALHTPQLWAEDGSIFLMQADFHGLGALTIPYAGYLHALPRLIAMIAPQLLDPVWWPTFYNGATFLIWLAVLARMFSPRLDLPGKPWLALAMIAVPHSGEVFGNMTNLQWLTAFVLIQQAVIAQPTTRTQRMADLLILALVTLTGPFGVAFVPLFVWRWWRDRSGDNAIVLLTVGACAALQLWFVLRTGPHFEYQDQPFNLWTTLVVLARRLVVWPLLGRDLANSLPGHLLVAIGAAFTAALGWASLRADRGRLRRVPLLAAFALILAAAVYRTRPDTWAADELGYGDRYFYIPRVLLAWLVIWHFNASFRPLALGARLVCAAVLVIHAGEYVVASRPDYHWSEHVEPIRRGVPANIPILPEGWTLEYRGRPSPQP